MKIWWTNEATDCLEHIGQHIAEDNPGAAPKTVTTILDRIEELTVFQTVAAWGREEATRELVYGYSESVLRQPSRQIHALGLPTLARASRRTHNMNRDRLARLKARLQFHHFIR